MSDTAPPFETIDVNLTEQEWGRLVVSYIQATFRPESVSVLTERLTAGGSVDDAIIMALCNEAVVWTLEQILIRQQQGDQ